MNTNKKHIIQTLCFDMQLPDKTAADNFADKLRTVDCQGMLVKVLSTFDDIEQTIRLDKVELDIGTIDLDNMELMNKKIMAQFEKILNKHIAENNIFSHKNFRSKNAQQTPGEEAVNEIEMILFYLHTGTLPWNIIDKPDMEQLFLKLLEKDPHAFKKALLNELKKEVVTRRISMVFGYSVIRTFIKQIITEKEIVTAEKTISLLETKISTDQLYEFRQQVYRIYLSVISAAPGQQINFSKDFLHKLSPLLQKFVVQDLQSLQDLFLQQVEATTDQQQELFYTGVLETIEALINKKQSIVNSKKIHRENIVKEKQEDLYDWETEPDAATADKELPEEHLVDRYFIDNAGLVLLNAAMLQRYFEKMEWVSGKKIVNEKARHKIMLSLDYLVWGRRKIHEYALVFNKVLAGLTPIDIADIKQELTEKEKAAADELIKEIIMNWLIVKNTSIENFRTSFLQRNGRLVNEDGGWQLHVESRGYDILIDSLPWTFSIIKLPWMQKPLFTQWQTKI